MAIFPCEVCSRRYPGPQQSLYVHLVEGGVDLGRKLRLCPLCFGERHSLLTEGAILTAVNNKSTEFYADDLKPSCMFCKTEDAAAMIYADAYPARAERRTFWGACCTTDTPRWLETFKIPT